MLTSLYGLESNENIKSKILFIGYCFLAIVNKYSKR